MTDDTSLCQALGHHHLLGHTILVQRKNEIQETIENKIYYFLNQCATAEVLHDSVSPQPHAVFFVTFLHPLSSRS